MTLTTTIDKPTYSPTTLEMIANGAASPAYLDIEQTLDRARAMLADHHLCELAAANAPIAAYRALATRLGAHAEQLFRDHVRETATPLLSGLTVTLPTWDSDHARLTYRLLLTYRQQAVQRIADMIRASNPGMR